MERNSFNSNLIKLLVCFLTVFSSSTAFAEGKTKINQDDFAIIPNNPKDQTGKIQEYLNQTAQKGGGQAHLSAGYYVIKGSLTIPTGVILTGSWSVPHHGILDKGTILHAYGGRGKEKGPALLELQLSSGVKGFTILYPDQKAMDIKPYPWTIHGKDMHNTIENITLVNSYQGICIGPEKNELHLIRNVFGCVLRRGIKIDNCTDIGRIENAHFNRHYWRRSNHDGIKPLKKAYKTAAEYMSQNLEAFIFARTDWQYVTNTFVYGAKVGYHFIKSEAGVCNGQFNGIGADWCRYCVLVDSPSIGILISNGQFVAGGVPNNNNTDDQIGILTTSNFRGSLQLSNCNFWGCFNNAMQLNGTGFTSMNQATINNRTPGKPSITINNGRASINQVFFNCPPPHIEVNAGVKKVNVSNNFADGSVKIINNAKDRLIKTNNE
ncbi:MAG: hypothetical protein ACYSSI_07925 [Planctomycetota bacterium]